MKDLATLGISALAAYAAVAIFIFAGHLSTRRDARRRAGEALHHRFALAVALAWPALLLPDRVLDRITIRRHRPRLEPFPIGQALGGVGGFRSRTSRDFTVPRHRNDNQEGGK